MGPPTFPRDPRRGVFPGLKWVPHSLGNLFGNDRPIIPFSTGGNQWVLTAAHLREKRLTVYDPTGTRDKHTNLLEALREYLRLEADRERNVEILESIDSWRLENCTDAPRQKNAVDRGVFICMYADCISAREPLDFEAADMNACRDRIAHNILREFGTQGGGEQGGARDRSSKGATEGGRCIGKEDRGGDR